MFQIIADGTPWEDSDGRTEWTAFEAGALAEVVESQGYEINVVAL